MFTPISHSGGLPAFAGAGPWGWIILGLGLLVLAAMFAGLVMLIVCVAFRMPRVCRGRMRGRMCGMRSAAGSMGETDKAPAGPEQGREA